MELDTAQTYKVHHRLQYEGVPYSVIIISELYSRDGRWFLQVIGPSEDHAQEGRQLGFEVPLEQLLFLAENGQPGHLDFVPPDGAPPFVLKAQILPPRK